MLATDGNTVCALWSGVDLEWLSRGHKGKNGEFFTENRCNNACFLLKNGLKTGLRACVKNLARLGGSPWEGFGAPWGAWAGSA